MVVEDEVGPSSDSLENLALLQTDVIGDFGILLNFIANGANQSRVRPIGRRQAICVVRVSQKWRR